MHVPPDVVTVLFNQNIEPALETIREAVIKRVADHPCRADHLR